MTNFEDKLRELAEKAIPPTDKGYFPDDIRDARRELRDFHDPSTAKLVADVIAAARALRAIEPELTDPEDPRVWSLEDALDAALVAIDAHHAAKEKRRHR